MAFRHLGGSSQKRDDKKRAEISGTTIRAIVLENSVRWPSDQRDFSRLVSSPCFLSPSLSLALSLSGNRRVRTFARRFAVRSADSAGPSPRRSATSISECLSTCHLASQRNNISSFSISSDIVVVVVVVVVMVLVVRVSPSSDTRVFPPLSAGHRGERILVLPYFCFSPSILVRRESTPLLSVASLSAWIIHVHDVERSAWRPVPRCLSLHTRGQTSRCPAYLVCKTTFIAGDRFYWFSKRAAYWLGASIVCVLFYF